MQYHICLMLSMDFLINYAPNFIQNMFFCINFAATKYKFVFIKNKNIVNSGLETALGSKNLLFC